MAKALRFVLFWLGTWAAYGLIYGAVYAYETVKSDRRLPLGHRSHGPLGLPELWELVLVAIVCGVGAFFTAMKFIRSESPERRKKKH
jgi:nitric oxide reductase large subunit